MRNNSLRENMDFTVRSRAPLRLGLAGGGTDVSPYSDKYGGAILNATINMFAHCTICKAQNANEVCFEAIDIGEHLTLVAEKVDLVAGPLLLHRAVYQHIIREFNGGKPLALRVSTWSDAPPGSGLGSSSTLVVAMITAYTELLALPLGEYDIAHLAFHIERVECGLAGGKQDQYAATFGGFNFMEFAAEDRVIVNPLRVRRHVELELEASLLLYYTGRSRESAAIIKDQVSTVEQDTDGTALAAMHQVKTMAVSMKEAVLRGEVAQVHTLIADSWNAKKRMAKSISNLEIDTVATTALESGANAVKVSGAGGGGFMMLFVDPLKRKATVQALTHFGGQFRDFQFTSMGAEAWKTR